MSEDSGMEVSTAKVKEGAGRLLPVPRLTTLVAIGIVIFLLFAFFTKLTVQFYASFLFLFYSLTQSMWISVILLGVFQTLLLVPFRIVNLLRANNLKEFRDNVEKIKIENEREYFLKRQVAKGERLVLFYMVNFYVQVISYLSIGRLFLTDFYQTRLDPDLLYSFVKYPLYPLLDRMFKLPYAWFSSTRDLGMDVVWIVWVVMVAIQVGILIFWYFRRQYAKTRIVADDDDSGRAKVLRGIRSLSTGYLVLGLFLSWYVIRHFPTNWSFRIFTGDVAIPNRTLNSITAIMTFLTLVWINLPRIRKKVELARAAGFDKKVISKTQAELFRQTLMFAGIVGVAAFYVTNLIPSAFELSIFTLEIISLLSPLTLDRAILKNVGGKK